MKLLMIYCSRFAYTPTVKVLEDAGEANGPAEYDDILVAFIQAEAEDESDLNGVEKKLSKNLKWAAGKNNTRRIMLHSFAHLSDSKASPVFTQELFGKADDRLRNTDYETYTTPFGYFLDLDMQAPGYSLARIFKSF
ncbi:MAG TPA: threonyl-tRNA synthetase editing domain-containing protein [Bacteroidales bacterium]|nr:threonyl-tRNA synthetase editing domain-containing protein [Bacteroidales bacterium]